MGVDQSPITWPIMSKPLSTESKTMTMTGNFIILFHPHVLTLLILVNFKTLKSQKSSWYVVLHFIRKVSVDISIREGVLTLLHFPGRQNSTIPGWTYPRTNFFCRVPSCDRTTLYCRAVGSTPWVDTSFSPEKTFPPPNLPIATVSGDTPTFCLFSLTESNMKGSLGLCLVSPKTYRLV